MNNHQDYNTIPDLLLVISTNGVIYLVSEFATPVISLCTACASLYYIVRKIRKEFF